MNKDIKFGSEAKKKILDGVTKLTNAVAVTLGPKGRCVMIEKANGDPHVTKDGVTVAKSINLSDRFENIGASVVKEASAKTADVAGDGTTTATVLTHSLVKNGMDIIEKGANPIDVKQGMDMAVKAVVKNLKAQSKAVNGSKDIEHIATISANNDIAVGEIIREAMELVGTDGLISVDNGKTDKIQLVMKDGMDLDRGFLSPYFVTNTKKNNCYLEQPLILVCKNKISTYAELFPILNIVSQTGRPFLLIAEDFDEQALATLIVNKMKGALNVCAIKAPKMGDVRLETLKDICALTNATLIDKDRGDLLEHVQIEHLGEALDITVSKDKTVIVDGGGTKENIQERIESIENELNTTDSDYQKEKLNERKAKLSGGVVVIEVGAPTETEMREVRDRVDDALEATKSAIDQGIVIGGGCALLNCLDGLQDGLITTTEGDVKLGVGLVMEALRAPITQIIDNAGKSGITIVDSLICSASKTIGYNAKTNKEEDLIKAGVIDPTKVVINAIKNASSSAGQILITECVMVNEIK